MRKKASIFFCTSFLLFPLLIFSQNLIITYDAKSGTMKYFQNEQEINKPLVKKGHDIILKIENYNNYLYDIDIQEKQEKNKIGSENNILGGFQTLDIGNLGQQLLQNIPSVPIELSESRSIPAMNPAESIISDESNQERQIRQLKEEAEFQLKKLPFFQQNIEATELIIKKYEHKELFRSIALDEVNKFKYNPQITTSKIKEQAEIILLKALGLNSQNDASLSDIIEQNNEDIKLKEILNKHENNLKKYGHNVENLSLIETELKKLGAESGELISLYFKMEKAVEESPQIISKSENITTDLNNLINVYKNRDFKDLMEIWYEYEAIQSNNFSTIHQSQAKEDVVTFDVIFNRKDSIPFTGAQKAIQLAPIKVSVYGGLKLNASVGINFAQFFDQPKSYFIRDNIIIAQEGDHFIPMITSFMHFYTQSPKTVSFGGSLGLGIPVGGGEGFGSASFFLGPSLFFGQSDRFVLNAGLMGGKVKKLALGYEEGDNFDGNLNILPTHSIYEIGYFIGLSFNLGK